MTDDPDFDPVPAYLKPKDVQDACPNESPASVWTNLRNAGLLQRFGERSHYRISASALEGRLPDYYSKVWRLFARRAEERDGKRAS